MALLLRGTLPYSDSGNGCRLQETAKGVFLEVDIPVSLPVACLATPAN
jgi:hypothetical protein